MELDENQNKDQMEEKTIYLKPRYLTTANCDNRKCRRTMVLNKIIIKAWTNGWYIGEMHFYCKYCGRNAIIKRKLNQKRKEMYERIFDPVKRGN